MQGSSGHTRCFLGGARAEACIISETFQKLEERVRWAVALVLGGRWGDGGKSPFLHGHIRFDIAVRNGYFQIP